MGAGGSVEKSQKESKEEGAEATSHPQPSPHASPRRSLVASLSERMLITGNGRKNSQRKLEPCQHFYLERCQGTSALATGEGEGKVKEVGDAESEGGGCWRCVDCKKLINDMGRITQEEDWKKRITEEEKQFGSSEERATNAVSRGVTLQWLLEFTKQHDCWLLPTWLVRRNIILPATASSRCRYVDLPEVRESGAVGRASTFVSHCWGAPWGSLMTALTSGPYDPNRRIWLDLFAVRQWEGGESESAHRDYRKIVELCPSFVLCCSPRPSHRLNSADLLSSTDDAQKILSLYRTWCLMELHAAVSAKAAIIIRCGAYQRPTFLSSQHSFKPNPLLLEKLSGLIDLRQALTSLSEDRAMLLKDAEECPGGVEGVNHLVKSVVKGAVLLCGNLCLSENENLYHAVCGDAAALDLLRMDPGQSLVQAAAGGYLSLVRLFTTPSAGAAGGTEAVANVESRCHGYTALMAAAAGGHVEIVQHLLSLSSPHTASSPVSVEATHPSTGNTALFYAASHGFHQTAELLLLKGAAIDALNSTLQTPLMVAAEKGHTHTVTFLLTRGAQINHHDAKGATSLLLAAAGGHASTVKVLLSKGAMKLIKNSEGYTALTIAEKMEYADCVALLSK